MEECSGSVGANYKVTSGRCYITEEKALGVFVTELPVDSSRPDGPYIKPIAPKCELRWADNTIHVHCGLMPYTIGCGCAL